MPSVGRMVKESMVTELTNELADGPNVFVTALKGLPAPEADALRQKLFGAQSRLLLVKRRLGRRVTEHLKVAGLADLLEGSVGLVLAGDDTLLAAKVIIEFVKAHEGQLTVRGAFIDGQLLDKARVQDLANLPPRPVLLAHVLGTIESPLVDVIFTLERLIGDLAWLAEQAAATRPAPAAEATAPEMQTSQSQAPEQATPAAAPEAPGTIPPAPETTTKPEEERPHD